jgi:hypothetical protein
VLVFCHDGKVNSECREGHYLWLDNAHRALDKAVLAAYGWPENISDAEILERLLTLNLQRAKTQ